MTRPRKPATSPEESGTVRQQIRALLEEGHLTALEISRTDSILKYWRGKE